jgi:thiol-disulfide isomerase/thioredoxin
MHERGKPLERMHGLRFRALALLCVLAAWLGVAPAAQPDFLPADQAFRLAVHPAGDGTLLLHWDIAPGYYLYRDRLTAAAPPGQPRPALERPPGQPKADPTFGVVDVYHGQVDATLRAASAGPLDIGWQGCAEGGACYPPQHRTVTLQALGAGPAAAATPSLSATAPALPPGAATPAGATDRMIVIGPLALPASLLLLAIAVAAGWWIALRVARRQALVVDAALYLLLACGLVAARLAFVLLHGAAYAQAPLAILNIRDGGWMPGVGFAAAALAALVVAWRRSSLGRPLAAAWVATTAVWIVANLVAFALVGARPQLPELTLDSLDGSPVRLASFRGRPLVVNLWATWCPPCRREMPVLAAGQQRYRDVQFVFVDQGEAPAKVRSFLSANGLALQNVLLDAHGDVALKLDQHALPATFFFDRDGRLVDVREGELSPATLGERLDRLHPFAP